MLFVLKLKLTVPRTETTNSLTEGLNLWNDDENYRKVCTGYFVSSNASKNI
jgi:hypothetical protein